MERLDMRNILIALCITLGSAPSLAAADAAKHAAVPASAQYSTEDTDIGTLVDDPSAAAIIDKYIPGFTANPQTEMARGMTLKQIQPYAADTVTDEVLKNMDAEFAAMSTKGK